MMISSITSLKLNLVLSSATHLFSYNPDLS
jgi:hypothetical protein